MLAGLSVKAGPASSRTLRPPVVPGGTEQRGLSMFKKIGLSCLALLAALAMSAGIVQAKSLDDIIKAGVIRIGINPNFPPNSSRGAGGDWEGFDIDIGNKIATVLGVKAEWVPTETP